MSPSAFIARWKGASGTELGPRPVNFAANLESLGKIRRLIDGSVGG